MNQKHLWIKTILNKDRILSAILVVVIGMEQLLIFFVKSFFQVLDNTDRAMLISSELWLST